MSLTKSENAQPIAQLGHPILRQKAKIVDDILSGECQQLIDDMMLTVNQAGGVGIAAPQVYQGYRIFIMCSKPNARYPDAPKMKPTAIINPEIIKASTEMEKQWEGCLSVPSMRGLVPRHKQISVKFFDRFGVEKNIDFEGFLARIFQHELDHLDGLSFIDRLDSLKDLVSESYWYQEVLAKNEH